MEVTEFAIKCPRCGYNHAFKRIPNEVDKTGEFSICNRCGRQVISGAFSTDGTQEYSGKGAYMLVSPKGILGGGVFMEDAFYSKVDEIAKDFGNGVKFMYTQKREDDKYYLINHTEKKEYVISDDDVICYEGIKKG